MFSFSRSFLQLSSAISGIWKRKGIRLVTQDDFVAALERDVIRIGVDGVLAYAKTQIPFLATGFAAGILNPILSFVIEAILSVAIRYTELGAYIIRTDVITAEQARDYEDAAIRNREIQESGSAKEKADAERAQIDAARDCIRLNR